jgi:hypothetical protein
LPLAPLLLGIVAVSTNVTTVTTTPSLGTGLLGVGVDFAHSPRLIFCLLLGIVRSRILGVGVGVGVQGNFFAMNMHPVLQI